jgi:4-amino-4-deoxy-L-arabinose transferase-like glycosyltransferase
MSKTIRLYILLILIVLVKIALSFYLGPIIDPDSPEYISSIENIYNGYRFSRNDYIDNQIKPTAYRMPLFPYFNYYANKILGSNKKENFAKTILITNTIFYLLILIFCFLISKILTNDNKFSLLSTLILSLTPNLFYNSFLVLTDTMFSFTIILFSYFFIKFIKTNQKHFLIISAITLGITLLTRPIMKFYILILIMIFLFAEGNLRSKIKNSAMFIFFFSITISPWLIRNYYKLNFFGFETNQGINTLWSSISIMDDYNPNDDEITSKIRKILVKYKNTYPFIGPLEGEREVRKTLNLSEVEASKYLNKIGLQTILSKPHKFLKIYLRGIINNLTSATSELKLIDYLFYKGYYDRQHQIMMKLHRWQIPDTKEIILIIPNFFFRFIHLIVSITVIISAIKFYKKDKTTSLFFLSIMIYFIGLTSLVASYDRYRLPVEFIISFYLTYFIHRVHWKTLTK